MTSETKSSTPARRRSTWPLAVAAVGLPLLGGCGMVVLEPSGDVAIQQRNLILQSTGLMLLIIVPVIVLTLLFAWRYRANNTAAKYDPEWHHSTTLEVVIWSAPLLIIIALGAITWLSTHTLDPYRSLMRIDATRPVPADVRPLQVQVVALDWKWLFIYPEQGIATVNELAAPVNVPIEFKLTSASVFNTFFIPALAGQIYTMPGMQTQMHAVINRPGNFDGMSAHYSGSGFSRMNFRFHGLSQAEFDQWVAKVRAGGEGNLDRAAYLKLEAPSEASPVQYYPAVEARLFDRILNMCVEDGAMCMADMNHIDMTGGGGHESRDNERRLQYDSRRAEQGQEGSSATFPASGRPPRGGGVEPQGSVPRPGNTDVNQGVPGPSSPTDPAPPQLNNRGHTH